MTAITACGMTAFLAAAVPARAAWTAAAYLGASATAAATLTLDQPAAGVRAEWPRIRFESRSFSPPPYYGYRIRWASSPEARAAIEAELIHLKVYARPGALAPAVERFSISHGLNLLLGNVVWRQPLRRRVYLAARAGVGVAIPHAESRVGGIDREQYEISSAALQAAAGPEFATSPHTRAFVEYKVTTAAPAVGVAGGTISGRYTSQHLAAGLGVAW